MVLAQNSSRIQDIYLIVVHIIYQFGYRIFRGFFQTVYIGKKQSLTEPT